MNPVNVSRNWHRDGSFLQQHRQSHQQPTGQQRGYGSAQNRAPQQASSTGAWNSGGCSASTLGQATTDYSGGDLPPLLPMTPQYTLDGASPTAYAYVRGDPGQCPWITSIFTIPSFLSFVILYLLRMLSPSPLFTDDISLSLPCDYICTRAYRSK